MRKAFLVALLFAAVHAAATLLIVRWANAAYQRWFDTGISLTPAESFGHLLSFALSFPFALRTLTLHPERVSTQALVASVAANSLLWAAGVYLIALWLFRRAAPHKGLHPTAK